MYRFKCPTCGRKCKLNKKLSKLRGLKENERVYHWECSGKSPQAPHAPIVFKVEYHGILYDEKDVLSQITHVTQLWLEDSEVYNLTDEWKQWMREKRYERLPTPYVYNGEKGKNRGSL